MTKQEILDKINEAMKTEVGNKARNSMGTSESFYNSYYLIGSCFEAGELSSMSLSKLNDLVRMANFVTEVFY